MAVYEGFSPFGKKGSNYRIKLARILGITERGMHILYRGREKERERAEMLVRVRIFLRKGADIRLLGYWHPHSLLKAPNLGNILLPWTSQILRLASFLF